MKPEDDISTVMEELSRRYHARSPAERAAAASAREAQAVAELRARKPQSRAWWLGWLDARPVEVFQLA